MLKTVQNPLEKYKLKSGIIIWYSHSVIGLYFNFSKQNPDATFFDLFIMSFSTGFQQEFVNCWKLFSYYKNALFQHDRSAAGFLIFILQYCHSEPCVMNLCIGFVEIPRRFALSGWQVRCSFLADTLVHPYSRDDIAGVFAYLSFRYVVRNLSYCCFPLPKIVQNTLYIKSNRTMLWTPSCKL